MSVLTGYQREKKEICLHNVSSYFESKLRQKYQALIGE